jgi:hypothetical protein
MKLRNIPVQNNSKPPLERLKDQLSGGESFEDSCACQMHEKAG